MKMPEKIRIGAAVIVLTVALAGCSNNEAGKTDAPVYLLVTNTQVLSRIDLGSGAMNCMQNVATVGIQALLKNPVTISQQQFNNVHITSYRVSYVRTDGGTAVPAAFTRTLDAIVPVGGAAANLPPLEAFTPDALVQAPFAALQPQNGGRDPETGRPDVAMDVIIQVFGATLAGENVTASTRFPLDFCVNCGGCA
jgi:hypothetical protein